MSWLAASGSGSRVRLSKHSGFGLDEDAAAGQAFQLGPDVLGVLGHDRQVQSHAEIAGSQGTVQVSEKGKNLLVGGVIREHGRRPGRISGGLAVVLPGERDEDLAG